MNLPEPPPAFRQATPSERPWFWRLEDADGTEVARGLVNYAAAEVQRIKGAHTRDLPKLLGYKGSDEVIHRDDLVVAPGGAAR